MFFCRYFFRNSSRIYQKFHTACAKVKPKIRTGSAPKQEESVSMIEIIQQTSKTEENLENKLPKNIRQIGNPEKDFLI